MNKFKFKGCVYPRRININFKFSDNKVEFKDININGVLSAEFKGNEFVAHFETEDDFRSAGFKYLGCVSSFIKEALFASIIDLAYFAGVGLILEIEYFVDETTNRDIYLPFEIPVVKNRYKENGQMVKRVHEIFDGRIDSWYSYKFLCDFNYAMLFPAESGFYCYRAIESLVCFFKTSRSESITKSTWEKFRAALGIEKHAIYKVKLFADPTRHGDIKLIVTEDKAEIFELTMDIFDKFVNFMEHKPDNVVSAIQRAYQSP